MSPEETPCSGEICVVCGKDTTGGRGFMTLHLEGRLLSLCCPMCRKVYEENPVLYARHQQTEQAIHDIEHKSGSDNPE